MCNQFCSHCVHDNLDLSVFQGEIVAIVGGSGSGKTTLLRSMLMLLKPTQGEISIFDIDLMRCSQEKREGVQRRWGVMFQQGALFSALTALENVMFPLNEFTDLDIGMQKEVARLKLALVGLSQDVATKYPSELSGGMKKRLSLARAIALDPELLFLDEPTAGLDPTSASELDSLIVHLRETLGLTVMIVTHDLDTLWGVPDRVAFLAEKKVLALSPMKELMQHSHPEIRAFFGGERGKKFLVQN